MVLLHLQLGGVLDRDDSLTVGDERGQHVEQRGLARAGAAADDAVEPRLHAASKHLEDRARARPERDEVFGRDRDGAEPPDRHAGTVEREGRNDCVEPRTIRHTGVDHRVLLVDPSTDVRDDPLDDLHQVLIVVERHVGLDQAALPLDEHRLRTVDHDVGHFRVAEQGLQRPEAEDVVDDLLDEALALHPVQRELPSLDPFGERLPEALGELVARRVADLFEVERLDQLVVEVSFDLRELDLPAAAGAARERWAPRAGWPARCTHPALSTTNSIDEASTTHDVLLTSG